jgi:hypothetical protein
MRPLRVLGLADSDQRSAAQSLVCEDPTTGEQFSIACDDRLRAGARGDLSRFGQLEIEMESQLRPREIQSRIRAGATVEQVAALAGTTAARVERFAFPVLLERASVAERAMKARPAIDGITAGISVAATVAATLSARGHDGEVSWDAFKDDDDWVLALTWNAGRSVNRAHWVYHPGPDGGTLSARDDAAAEIVDPALRILRPLRPVSVSAAALDPTLPTEQPRRVGESSRTAHSAGSKLPTGGRVPSAPLRERPGTRNTPFGAPQQSRDVVGSPAIPADTSAIVAAGSAIVAAGSAIVAHGSAVLDRSAERIVEDTITDERAGVNPPEAPGEAARTGTDSAGPAHPPAGGRRGGAAPVPSAPPAQSAPQPVRQAAVAKSSRRGQRPAMPSWEDVLLGTKSTGR